MNKIKAGDTARTFIANLQVDGLPLDLSSASSASFIMRRVGESQGQAFTATIGSPATSGVVSYKPATQDVSTPGVYMIGWRVQFSDGSSMTFPSDGWDIIQIEENF